MKTFFQLHCASAMLALASILSLENGPPLKNLPGLPFFTASVNSGFLLNMGSHGGKVCMDNKDMVKAIETNMAKYIQILLEVKTFVSSLSVLMFCFFQIFLQRLPRMLQLVDGESFLLHKGIGKQKIRNPARTNPGAIENSQREIVGTLASLAPTEKSSIYSYEFSVWNLRMAIMVDATLACWLELESRISFRLEMVPLEDLLMLCIQASDSMFDVDTVHRILVHFLLRIEEEENDDCGYE
ncbi:hypothetical protein RHGRI_015683 [Rhododendron griersonianum]|uniref:NPH3 domain-containing protein n=1 Tax=Rhododendron griersonianum TaxID=479676 RepID=A0AAV6KER0_9ERIC|nr:hypothetical protein RHGRI_015683 [Rhododendron griersonianum]